MYFSLEIKTKSFEKHCIKASEFSVRIKRRLSAAVILHIGRLKSGGSEFKTSRGK
jgi:hypothetical protein